MPTTTYPTSLDVFTDPAPATIENVLSHAGQHDVANDAILALETKLGIGQTVKNTVVTTTVSAPGGVTPNITNGAIQVFNGNANITAINLPTGLRTGDIFILEFHMAAGTTYTGWSASYNFNENLVPPATAVTGTYTDTYVFFYDGTFILELARNEEQGWIPVTFQNSWVNFGSTFQVCQFKRIQNRVYLRGLMKSGTINTTAFTLPVGYRPPADLLWGTSSNALFGENRITAATGGFVPSVGNNGYVAIDFSFDLLA